MNSNCININDFIHICIILHVMSGSQAKVIWKSVCFVKIKVVNIWHFHSAQQVSWASIYVVLLIHESIWLPDNSSVSGFDNVFTFFILSFSTLVSFDVFFYLFLSAALWIVFSPMFTMCNLTVIIIVISGLIGVWLWNFSNMVQNGIKWICLCVS